VNHGPSMVLAPAAFAAEITLPSLAMSRALTCTLSDAWYPVMTCLPSRSVVCGYTLRSCVWMSLPATPSFLTAAAIRSAALEASSRAALASDDVVVTPSDTSAVSGAA